MIVPFICTALPLIAFQTVSWSSGAPLVRTNSHCAKSILSGAVAATIAWACSAGVGAGLIAICGAVRLGRRQHFRPTIVSRVELHILRARILLNLRLSRWRSHRRCPRRKPDPILIVRRILAQVRQRQRIHHAEIRRVSIDCDLQILRRRRVILILLCLVAAAFASSLAFTAASCCAAASAPSCNASIPRTALKIPVI